LEIDVPGELDSLHLVTYERREPGPGQVEIAVEAAGVSSRDLLLAAGVLPPSGDSQRVRLGFECAGTVARLGPGPRSLEIGQRVVAITTDGAASHVVVDASQVFPIPDALSFVDAAALPDAHVSAYHGLHHIAHLSAGERVLIHSATDSIGLAAIQWARHVGADIYVTADSDAKRALLRSRGIEHISDSRSTRFVEDVMRWTDGEGVDVVLNTLSGELMRRSLGLLRPGGRFVDLNLRDALSNSQLGMSAFARGIVYALMNVGEMLHHSPERVRSTFLEILQHLDSGALTSIEHGDAPLSLASDVFLAVERGEHVGKFVFTAVDPARLIVDVPLDAQALAPSRTSSYLITGGLGGLGLSLAHSLAEQGAGHLVLLGRRGITHEDQREAIAAIEAVGARVTVATADVADLASLELVVAALPDDLPLRGIVHAAGLLDDAMLLNQSREKFERVMAPKVAGAWNLHLLSKARELDFFVLYSSAAAILGSPGQGNYAAANSFLDALAHHRRDLGLPALSLGWGPFSDVGLAAIDDNRGARLSARGLGELSPAVGVELFSALVNSSVTQIAPCPFDAHQWVEFYPEAAQWPFLDQLLAEAPPATGEGAAGLLTALQTCSAARGHELLLDLVLQELANVVRLAAADLDPRTPFTDLGVDSLMGIELRNRIKASTSADLPSTVIWTYPTPTALANYLVNLLVDDMTPNEPQAPTAPSIEETATTDAALADDESLLDELTELEGLLDD
jgi:NADPH:quinone reductase-like Zn-dependent oxidoreductase/acyl carrier protein